MLHNTRYRQGKSKQKSSPSALSDAEVPRPVSPLSDVPGRRPKRLWNFSDTAGVCHSMSANRANVDLWNRTMAEERRRSTSTYAELTHRFSFAFWLHLSVNLPAGLDSMYLCEVVIPYKTMSPDWNEEKHTSLISTNTYNDHSQILANIRQPILNPWDSSGNKVFVIWPEQKLLSCTPYILNWTPMALDSTAVSYWLICPPIKLICPSTCQKQPSTYCSG